MPKTKFVALMLISLIVVGCSSRTRDVFGGVWGGDGLLNMAIKSAVINRYNDIPYDPTRHGDTRYDDYSTCVAKDNTSWDVIDACMLAKGYTVKGS